MGAGKHPQEMRGLRGHQPEAGATPRRAASQVQGPSRRGPVSPSNETLSAPPDNLCKGMSQGVRDLVTLSASVTRQGPEGMRER